jgi:flagellar biosynthesis/type III secretory pathway ATPase
LPHPHVTGPFANARPPRARDARDETCGRVVQLIGLVVESEGPLAALGEVCRIQSARHDGDTLAEVVGFRNHHLLLMPLGEMHGIHPGSEVIATGAPCAWPWAARSRAG